MRTAARPWLQLVTRIFKTLLPADILPGRSAETGKCAAGERRRLDGIFGREIFSLACFPSRAFGRSRDGHGARAERRSCADTREGWRGEQGACGRLPGLHVSLLFLPSALVVRRPSAHADRVSPVSVEDADSPTCPQKQVVPHGAPEDGAFSFLKGGRVFSLYLVRKPSIFPFFHFAVFPFASWDVRTRRACGICPHLGEGLSADGARLPWVAPCV